MNRFLPSASECDSSTWGQDEQISESKFGGCPQAGSHDWQPADDDNATDFPHDQAVDGLPWATRRKSARVFVLPLHYEANYQYPLVVWLHSDGYNEHQIEDVIPHVSLRNYIAVGVRGSRAADSRGHRFDWSESPAAIVAAHDAVAEAIDLARQRYSVHPQRVVLAGYRGGGAMALRLGLRNPQICSAVISLGGHFPSGGGLVSDLAELRQRRLPMLWQFAGQSSTFCYDRLVADIRLARLLRASVEIRHYQGDDEMNTATLADVNDWLMRRVVSAIPAESDQWASNETQFSPN